MMCKLLRSEEGSLAEWIVGALVIGIGCMPIVLGIGEAILDRTSLAAHRIGAITWSGW